MIDWDSYWGYKEMSYEKVAFELELEKESDLGTESRHTFFYSLIQQMSDFSATSAPCRMN